MEHKEGFMGGELAQIESFPTLAPLLFSPRLATPIKLTPAACFGNLLNFPVNATSCGWSGTTCSVNQLDFFHCVRHITL